MKFFDLKMQLSILASLFFLFSSLRVSAHTGPFDGKNFKERIAYSYEYLDRIEVNGLAAGSYDLLWMDTISGETIEQKGISVDWGNAAFAKPDSFGSEVVVYIERQH